METTLTGENIIGGLQHAYDLQMWFTTPIFSSGVHPGKKKKKGGKAAQEGCKFLTLLS